MAVRVQATSEAPVDKDEPPQNPLAALRKRREELVDRLYIDLKVPRWDDNGGPEIWVRYRPIGAVEFTEKLRKREEEKPRPDDWAVLANADVLIGCCQGVYAVIDGDKENKYSLRPGDWGGTWTRFDPTLGKNLGVHESAKAVDVVRALYLTDGDLLDAVDRLMQFSSKKNEEADQDF